MNRLITPALAALLLSACIDNSGGLPPPGEEVELERVILGETRLTCGSFQQGAALVLADGELADVDALCPDMPEDAREALVDEASALEGSEALVLVNVELGGCIEEHAVVGTYVDGDTVNVWTLVGDSSYERPGTGCTADLGESTELYRVADRGEATQAEVVIGRYNPDFPGAPALPGG